MGINYLKSKNMSKTIQLFLFLAIALCFAACESEYSKTVKKELKTGVIHKDLILGLKIGQTQKEFYDHCWQLNKQQLVSQGSGNKFAKHFMPRRAPLFTPLGFTIMIIIPAWPIPTPLSRSVCPAIQGNAARRGRSTRTCHPNRRVQNEERTELTYI